MNKILVGWLALLISIFYSGQMQDISAAMITESSSRANRNQSPPLARTPINLSPTGLQFGMTTVDVALFYDTVLNQDYAPLYAKTSPGLKMKQLDAALAEEKAAFRLSEISFGNAPTRYDNTALKGEYRYANNESMMTLTRQGVTRYFFFVQKRLWKFYDEWPMKSGGSLGANYQEAVSILGNSLGIPGRVLARNPAQGLNYPETDWVDSKTHLRAVDRTAENLVGIVLEDRFTLERRAMTRTPQPLNLSR